ncbi:hypothetical protein HDV00_007707 [Rhizophlyctis rosea]|nr:hypothetical protein HDV00_007707 [Rhizophlyctis rosea]
MTQGNALTGVLATWLGILEDIQLLAFAFRPEAGFGHMPWWMPYLFNPLSYKPTTDTGFAILFYVAFGFLVVTCIFTLIAAVSLNSSKIKVIWPLKTLRFLTQLLSTILLIPIYEIMIYGFVCHDTEMHVRHMVEDPQNCVQFLNVVIPAALGLLYITWKAPLISLVFIRINPSDTSHSSKTTGRIDAVYTFFRFILVIVLEFAGEEKISAVMATVTIISFIMLILTARYQPMFNAKANDGRAGVFAMSFWSGIQAGICMASGGYESPAGFAFLCVWLVPGFISGYMASYVTRTLVCRGVYRRMKERQEHMDSMEEGGSVRGSKQLTSSKLAIRSSALIGPELGKAGVRDIIVNKVDDIVRKVTVEPVRVFRSPADVEMSCRFLQRNKDHEAWILAESIFDAGIEQYPGVSGLPLMKSHYINDFTAGDDIDELWDCLDVAKSRKPHFDIRFFIFYNERSIEQEHRKEDLAASTLNITGYAEIMAMERSARRYHLEAVLALKALYEYLKSDKVATDCIPYLLSRVDDNRRSANRSYQAMLNKYPNSKQVLRRYSAFLLTVANDAEEATKLLNRAEDIENAEAREMTGRPMDGPTRSDLDGMISRFDNMSAIREASTVEGPGMSMDGSPSAEIVDRQILSVEAVPAATLGVEPENNLRRRSSVGFVGEGGDARDTFNEGNENRRGSDTERFRGMVHSKSQEKRLGFISESEVNVSQTLEQRLEEARKKEKGWKAGPGSQPSVTSATSSQRDARQMRYFRNLIDARLSAPIARFNILMNVGSFLLLGILIAGCALTIKTYGDIATAMDEAFARMRPRATMMRLSMYVRLLVYIGSLGPGMGLEGYITYFLQKFAHVLASPMHSTSLPLLYKYYLNSDPTYWIREFRLPVLTLTAYNPYFLGEFLYESGLAMLSWPIENFFDPYASLATETRVWLDNMIEISNAFGEMASRGVTDFLISNALNMQICYGLLAATIIISLLTGVVLFRPILESTTRRQVQILSLVNMLPKRYLNEKVDALEVEVENIMEELEEELADGTQALRGARGGAIPSETIMRNYSKRKLTKRYIGSLVSFALCGACMYIPSLSQSQQAGHTISTIGQLTERYYAVAGTCALALEFIANDGYSWRPSEPKLWYSVFLEKYQAARLSLLQSQGQAPSLYNFPSAAAYETADGICHLPDPHGCDPTVRSYNASQGFTYELVTSSMEVIYSRWYEQAAGFYNDPPATQNFGSPRITYIVGLIEDVAEATNVENQLMVKDIVAQSNTAQSLNIFVFVLALGVLITSYILVFRNVVTTLQNEMRNISNLYFSLPPGLIQSVPELRRFIESGGAIMPATMQQKK